MTDVTIAEQASTEQKRVLSLDETREVLTPFAFKIDENLFGTPLAKSWKRLVAILIDLLCIALLSQSDGVVLAIVLAIVFFRLGSNKRAKDLNRKKGKKRRFVLKLVASFILFLVLLEFLPSIIKPFDDFNEDEASIVTVGNNTKLSTTDVIENAAAVFSLVKAVSAKDCVDFTCWQKAYSPLPEQLISLGVDKDEAHEMYADIVSETSLNDVEKKQLIELLQVNDEQIRSNKARNTANQQKLAVADTVTAVKEKVAETKPSKTKSETSEPKEIEYSIVKQIKALIDDLGIGIGWTALYFTVFTALWRGQTPGKKLLRIRVLQLNGKPLTMMDSFGRYGGYGAGIATGLFGFLQIVWDPNRQAMHDKISSTVVVDYHADVSPELVNAVHDGEVTAAK